MKISLIIITKNEEKNIGKCIMSVPFADEVIVVDSGSTDTTGVIAAQLGAKFIFNEWAGYGKQKQFAIDLASNDWVLLLDAVEYLTPPLASEILHVLKNKPEFNSYRIPRKQIFMSKECHFGKSVDYPVRLVNRNKGAFDLKHIHESFVPLGASGELRGYMMHNSGITVYDRCVKIMRDLELELLHNDIPSLTIMNVTVDPFRYFLSYYIKRQAFRDGIAGFVMTALFSIQMFLQNAAQYEKNLSKKGAGKMSLR